MLKEKKLKVSDKTLIAKKDFHIVQNEVDLRIKKGEVLDKVPKRFIENLRTEGVID